MVTHNLTFGQRYYLQKMSLWIHNTQIMLWGEDTPIKINGKEKVLSRYYFYVNDILSREGGGWYTNVERDMLNELRERYINDSMYIHYVNGIWLMSRIDLSFEQRYFLEKMKDWIYADYIRDLKDGDDGRLKVNGLDSTIRRYKMEIEAILLYGWYTESDKEWLNELRERFLKKSLDIHLVDGIWI